MCVEDIACNISVVFFETQCRSIQTHNTGHQQLLHRTHWAARWGQINSEKAQVTQEQWHTVDLIHLPWCS